MGTFLLLMTEASAVGGELALSKGESGFSLNTNILDTNLINLAIIITLLEAQYQYDFEGSRSHW